MEILHIFRHTNCGDVYISWSDWIDRIQLESNKFPQDFDHVPTNRLLICFNVNPSMDE